MDIKQFIAARIKSLLCIVLLISGTPIYTTAYAMPPEFTATYYAETYGMTVARATYTLKHTDDGISFSQHSEPIGLAALFSDDELDETSLLSLHNGQLLLDAYHFAQKDGNKDRDIQLAIEWKNSDNNELTGTISGIAEGMKIQLETQGPVWDTLSFQIPVMMNTTANNPPQEHAILVKGELKTYSFITHGNEEIIVGGHAIQAIKIERRSEKEDEPIFFWVAAGLNNLPVRIEKWKNEKPRITMLLNEASFPSNSNLGFRAAEDTDDEF